MVLSKFIEEWNNKTDKIEVHTSGSTGEPTVMWVEKKRMENSARLTCDFLDLNANDTALLCLSPDYIAGKMMIVRSMVRRMKLFDIGPCGHPLSDDNVKRLPKELTFAAMVPMQVYNSLQVENEKERLKHIKHIIIGGGSIDSALEQELKHFPNHIWSTYGMTETLSHIAMRRINGENASEWYKTLDGVTVNINDDGCLVINAPQVCENVLTTNDIAVMGSDNSHFKIIGRKDNIINTGGIKVQIEELEQKLKPFIDSPFMISKRKDKKFGEIIVMLVESEDTKRIKEICLNVLKKYWQPRDYITTRLPMTQNGKPARAEAERIAESYTQPSR